MDGSGRTTCLDSLPWFSVFPYVPLPSLWCVFVIRCWHSFTSPVSILLNNSSPSIPLFFHLLVTLSHARFMLCGFILALFASSWHQVIPSFVLVLRSSTPSPPAFTQHGSSLQTNLCEFTLSPSPPALPTVQFLVEAGSIGSLRPQSVRVVGTKVAHSVEPHSRCFKVAVGKVTLCYNC